MPRAGGASPGLEAEPRGFVAGERSLELLGGNGPRLPAAETKTVGDLTGGDWHKLPQNWGTGGTRGGTPVVNDDGTIGGVPGFGSSSGQAGLAGKLASYANAGDAGLLGGFADAAAKGAALNINVAPAPPAADEWADPFGMGMPPMPPPTPEPEPSSPSSAPATSPAKSNTGALIAGAALLAALLFL